MKRTINDFVLYLLLLSALDNRSSVQAAFMKRQVDSPVSSFDKSSFGLKRKGTFRQRDASSRSSTAGRPMRLKRKLSRSNQHTQLRAGNISALTRFQNLINAIPFLRSTAPSLTHGLDSHRGEYNPLKMYVTCMGITLMWIVSGTLFYSYCNDWPLPQSFFYAVDAGMSIGFCTDVAETKLVSKAFTIVYILLGASVVGGALALFIQDAMEGVSAPSTSEYQLFLEKNIFKRSNLSNSGTLSFPEFRTLILSSINEPKLSEDEILILWNKFDRLKDGVIHFEEFTGTFRGVKRLVKSIQHQQSNSNPLGILALRIRMKLQQAWQLENRIYFCWLFWVLMGILWGMIDQHWDPITATHFSISALATGGLTAPQVNSDGILPAEPSIFCGVYCLVGIPLFALTLGHFAKALVEGHVSAMEAKALTRPMSLMEFQTAKHLTTNDSLVHLSDYIVMQLLRQGRISSDTLKVLKQNFELLDADKTGTLTPEQATSIFTNSITT